MRGGVGVGGTACRARRVRPEVPNAGSWGSSAHPARGAASLAPAAGLLPWCSPPTVGQQQLAAGGHVAGGGDLHAPLAVGAGGRRQVPPHVFKGLHCWVGGPRRAGEVVTRMVQHVHQRDQHAGPHAAKRPRRAKRARVHDRQRPVPLSARKGGAARALARRGRQPAGVLHLAQHRLVLHGTRACGMRDGRRVGSRGAGGSAACDGPTGGRLACSPGRAAGQRRPGTPGWRGNGRRRHPLPQRTSIACTSSHPKLASGEGTDSGSTCGKAAAAAVRL